MTVHNGKPTSYHLIINEEQRVLIHRALEQLIQTGEFNETDSEQPLQVLEGMFYVLPQVELVCPGATHAFYL